MGRRREEESGSAAQAAVAVVVEGVAALVLVDLQPLQAGGGDALTQQVELGVVVDEDRARLHGHPAAGELLFGQVLKIDVGHLPTAGGPSRLSSLLATTGTSVKLQLREFAEFAGRAPPMLPLCLGRS